MKLTFIEMMDLDRFLPVMSSLEVLKYEMALMGLIVGYFSPEQIARWVALLEVHNSVIQSRFNSAVAKSLKN